MKISQRLVIITALFVTCLITANVITTKLIGLGFLVFPAAIIVFPLSYIFGDVLTEVYGFSTARRVIWLGFLCNLIFVFFVWIGQILPAASFWKNQEAYVNILGAAPRILLASFLGYLVGEFSNSMILSRLKVIMQGRWLWVRTISSTVVGEGFDTAIFLTVAFFGTPSFIPIMIIYHWTAKVLIEIAATPITYVLVNWLKKAEATDQYDAKISFNPFSVKAD
jgi:hypothetical protein